jgi:PAS domain S-box-containing protein
LVLALLFAALVGVRLVFVERRLRLSRRVEGDLRASEAKFSGILAIAADAIITVDQHQRIVHFNRGAEEIFGYSAADAIGRHLNVLLPARFRTGHDAHMERFARAPETARRMGERREIFGLRSTGKEFPAEASISKLISPDGILFTVVLRDITSRVRDEQNERFLADAATQLAHSLEFRDAMQAIADIGVPRIGDACIVDILEPGDTLSRITSTRHRAELSVPLAELARHPLHWDSPSPIIDTIRRRRRSVAPIVDADWLEANEEPGLVQLWLALGAHSMVSLPLSAGGVTYGALTIIAIDPHCTLTADQLTLADKLAALASITIENAHLYGLAQNANRARDAILGVVSHDLRNPLSAIAMCARVLDENPPTDSAERQKMLTTIRESTEWMNRLIEDLLDVANLERGQMSLKVQEQEPAQLVLQALHMFEIEAGQQGIAIDVRLPTNLPPIDADAARIVQVLGNLIRNAIKFTPRGGRVAVGITPRDGGVLFSVSDNGPGIPADNQARVFERYWHASNGARAHGSGLGLSIAKGIVEAHGGHISLHSDPGQGATFSFTVPGTATRAG